MDNTKNDDYYVEKLRDDLALIVHETLCKDIPDLLQLISNHI